MKRALLLVFALHLAGCSKPTETTSEHYADLYRKLHPTIVFLKMRAPSDDPKAHGRIADAYGTAFVVASGDWGTRFLTDKHVIDGAHALHATFGDDARAQNVRVVAEDAGVDLALLETTEVKNAAVAPLGDSASVVPGQPVGVMGYPIPDAFQDEGLGTTASIYTGHVASLRKDAIELDLAIIPGESGGPVFNTDGKVIGIAESRFDEERAIGFATPIDAVKPFLRRHAR